MFLTGPAEILNQIKNTLKDSESFSCNSELLSTVTLTCTGITDPQVTLNACRILDENKINYSRLWQSAMSLSFLIKKENKNTAIMVLHQLIE